MELMKSLFNLDMRDDAAFEALLQKTVDVMNREALACPKMYAGLLGSKLEDKVVEVLRQCAVDTCFEHQIMKYSGQRFPDIVVGGYYGVEVKTTKYNHWKSTGSSVAEGTRVEGVERVYLLFGKMCEPIRFVCKLYEECLSEVVVTHSPRYQVDMNLSKGETIFDKLGIPYNELRRQPNPIRTILGYYRSRLKEGEELWWLDNDNLRASNLVIRMWSSLSQKEKRAYRIKGFVFFPELLSKRSDKFNRMAVWLATREGIVCPSLRDVFSAGGKVCIVKDGEKYPGVSKVIGRLYRELSTIKELVQHVDCDELQEYWMCPVDNESKWETWCRLAIKHLETINTTRIPLEKLIR